MKKEAFGKILLNYVLVVLYHFHKQYKGSHVYERFIILKTDNVIPLEERDPNLVEKMLAEHEAIVVRAMQELKKFYKNGYRLELPDEAQNNLKEFEIQNSPAVSFYQECCHPRLKVKGKFQIDNDLSTVKIYDFFKAWSFDVFGIRNTSQKAFISEIANFLNISIDELQIRNSTLRTLIFTIKQEFYLEYAERVGILISNSQKANHFKSNRRTRYDD